MARRVRHKLCALILVFILCVPFITLPIMADDYYAKSQSTVDTENGSTNPPAEEPPAEQSENDSLFSRIGNLLFSVFDNYHSKTIFHIDNFMKPDNLSSTFLDTLTKMLTRSTSETVASMFDPLLQFSLSFMLKIEDAVSSLSLGNSLSAQTIKAAYNSVYILACALALLKFLGKGCQIYLLWRDGDPETSPLNMLTGLASGLFMMVIFPTLYDIMVTVTTAFSAALLNVFHLNSQKTPTQSFLSNLVNIGAGGFIQSILCVIWTIMIIILVVKMMGRGVELLVLRIGFPISCLGLIDSDGGLFKGYMQIFLKTMATSVIQICLLSLSFSVVTDVGVFNLLIGICIATAAFSTPALMQSLLIQSPSGGGVGQKIYSTGMAINMLRGLVGK